MANEPPPSQVEPDKREKTPPKVEEEKKDKVVGLRRKPTIVNKKPAPEPEIPDFGEEPSLLLKEIVQILLKREKLCYDKKELEKLRMTRIKNPKQYHKDLENAVAAHQAPFDEENGQKIKFEEPDEVQKEVVKMLRDKEK